MLQLAAALFFVVALIAPIAVIVLTLESRWLEIVNALTGRHYASSLPHGRPVRPRGGQSSRYRAAQPPRRSARAAA